jgi:hypothetical protein
LEKRGKRTLRFSGIQMVAALAPEIPGATDQGEKAVGSARLCKAMMA